MTSSPLAVQPLEIALLASLVVGLAITGVVVVMARRGRASWLSVVVVGWLAVCVPVVGPVAVLVGMAVGLLRRHRSGAGHELAA